MRRNTYILMTATVNPGHWGMARSESALREQDYMHALKFWLTRSLPVDGVVFVENSQWDLHKLKAMVKALNKPTPVEFISISSNRVDTGRGRGYAEWCMIREAMEVSPMLGKASSVYKITGRLTLSNSEKMFPRLPNADLITDNLDGGFWGLIKRRLGFATYEKWCDSRFMSWSVTYWDSVLKYAENSLDERKGVPLERHLFDLALEGGQEWDICTRLPVEPIYCGVCGGNGMDYMKDSRRFVFRLQRVLRWIENVFRVQFKPV